MRMRDRVSEESGVWVWDYICEDGESVEEYE